MKNTTTHLQRLEEIGFRKSGDWLLSSEGKIQVKLNDISRTTNALYTFVLDGEVVYIGKTTQHLRKRLYGYQNPKGTQATNLRGRDEILSSLIKGHKIEVFVLPDNGLFRFGGFHLNLAAGLEDSLINDIRPRWNKRFGSEDAKAKARALKDTST